MEKVAHSESPKVVAWQDIGGLVILTEVKDLEKQRNVWRRTFIPVNA